MKSESTYFTLTNVILVAGAGLLLQNAGCMQLIRNAIFPNIVNGPTVTEARIQELRSQISSIRELNDELTFLIKRTEREAETKDHQKLFLEDLPTVFNVYPLAEMAIKDKDYELLSEFDPRNDTYYQRDPAVYERMSELYEGYVPNGQLNDRQIYAKWSGPKIGYGVFANMNLPAEQFIGDYTGELVDDNFNTDYMWSYPFSHEKDGKEVKYGIDARKAGNLLRFVNHISPEKLNAEVVYFIRHNMWHVGYRTTRAVAKDEQIFVSYGAQYWNTREMHDPTIEVAEGKATNPESIEAQ